MKSKDLRELTDEELKKKGTDLAEEMFNLKFRHSSGQIESPAKIRQARRDKAKVLTILRERTSQSEKGKQ